MKLLTIFSCFHFVLFSQSFEPIPEEFGTSAIHKDSSIIVSWAKNIDLKRGYVDINNPNLGMASFGIPENALQKAEGNSFDVVSLGDSGVAILTFEHPIFNGDGPDFVVFENAFANNLLELAFVEVSSDGINYARFPAISEIPLMVQLTGFEYTDCRYVYNLAGKYRQAYGTPFDLSEIEADLVNKNNITHIKIIDVIGAISGEYKSYDKNGNIINDPYPTAFESSGFDLDGVGVIHQKQLGINLREKDFFSFNNPIINNLKIINTNKIQIRKISLKNYFGQIVFHDENNFSMYEININCKKINPGIYFLEIESEQGRIFQYKLSKLNNDK